MSPKGDYGSLHGSSQKATLAVKESSLSCRLKIRRSLCKSMWLKNLGTGQKLSPMHRMSFCSKFNLRRISLSSQFCFSYCGGDYRFHLFCLSKAAVWHNKSVFYMPLEAVVYCRHLLRHSVRLSVRMSYVYSCERNSS